MTLALPKPKCPVIELRPGLADSPRGSVISMMTEVLTRSAAICRMRDEIMALRAAVARKDAIITEQELRIVELQEELDEIDSVTYE